jgi:hypothetical protein
VDFGVGTGFVKAVADDNISIGEKDETSQDAGDGADLWEADNLANFSAGLFGLENPPQQSLVDPEQTLS